MRLIDSKSETLNIQAMQPQGQRALKPKTPSSPAYKRVHIYRKLYAGEVV